VKDVPQSKLTLVLALVFFIKVTLICSSASEAQWKQTNGPYAGGYVKSLGLYGKILFAGTLSNGYHGGGLFASTDYGSNWRATALRDTDIYAIASDSAGVYVGTDNGILFSTDNGLNWIPLDSGLTSRWIESLTVAGESIYAGTGSGLFVSTNQGETWSSLGLLNSIVYTVAIHGAYIFAGTDGSAYRSGDNGETWVPINSGFIYHEYVYSFAMVGDQLFVGTYNGVYVSSDDGQNWSGTNDGLTETEVHSLYTCVDAKGETILLAGVNGGIFTSKDEGKNWQQTYSGWYGNTYVYGFAASANGIGGTNVYAATADHGVLLSTDYGISWALADQGLNYGNVNTMSEDENVLFAGTSGDGVFSSSDGGNTWTSSGLEGGYVASMAFNGSALLAATLKGVFRSTDHGVSWIPSDSGLSNVSLVAVMALGSIFYGISSNEVYSSTNNGASWASISNGISFVRLYALTASDSDIFVGGFSPTMHGPDYGGVFRTTDGGQHWTAVDNGLSDIDVNSLAFGGSAVLAGTMNGGIFRSTNEGENWTPADTGLTNSAINSLYSYSEDVFAAAGNAYLTTDGGAHWTSVGEGLNGRAQTFTVLNSVLYAGVYGNGVWRRPLSEMITSVKRDSAVLPVDFALAQNYPNPFNPSTVITYQLPMNSHVVLKIYDVLGREIETLVNEDQKAGSYEVQFEGSNLPSGVYFYRLSAQNYVKTLKMVHLK